ncbi:MAG: histidine--tRNA ligase [Gallionellales bacterium 35-53-114]|jgi:histidyl-tRNA synthetase|nr:MAG: histidine--tRNA ligase [Gallionellales bacterium 35-53-114]OYZ64672.1 MAG: histidine--tRNA ligase [Gallionellales bacterium 24-53-125]OZB07789.1 MAG: histidine--tRNA ligase [Gallionellales bacterium 39-52-133]HQS58497.1 histidine--tRNA ligase [Gallionellaceae bacterium]HQS74838.1 histidine--tRNA ligase [Gallionellaceae bacterium]
MSNPPLQAVRGMNDILPDEARLWLWFEDTVREWLDSYGYRNIRMPLVEPTALFKRAIGEVTDIVEKEMYSFEDSLNGDQLTLRPEGTASCVRAVIQHNLLYNAPQRLYYSGPMFRHERPQKGRYRQFHQIGVEALGYADPDIDAEQILMCARLWRKLGLRDVTLQINTLGDAAARKQHREKLIAYLEQYADLLDEDARRRLHTNPLRILDSKNPAMQELITGAPKLMDELHEDAILHFEAVQSILKQHEVVYEINPRLVRGLDYYNRTVFEWVTDRLGAQGTICAGGRYDGLIEQIGGKPAAACGFAMGIERLLSLLQEEGEVKPLSALDVYLVHQGELADAMASVLAEQLRDAGLRVALHSGGGSFKSQMKKADSSSARFALIVGDDEAQAGQATLKPLRGDGEQLKLAQAELAQTINKMIKKG